jgi:hypothetical protein
MSAVNRVQALEATGPVRAQPIRKRPRNTVPLAPGASKDVKRLAAVVLEVLAGLRTPLQAAEALGRSEAGYYQLEARALRGLLEACVPKPKGRQANPAGGLAQLQRENERLRRDLQRQQSLVRVTQRSIGLTPPPTPPPKAVGKKKRKRQPVVRALSLATRLRQEAEAPASAPVASEAPAPSSLVDG